LKIGILLGDDIGLEVVPEAVKVIKAASGPHAEERCEAARLEAWAVV
jgi:isocitrate/isopropylmalate dehydrogenase